MDIIKNKRYRKFLSPGLGKTTDDAKAVLDSVTWTDANDLLDYCRDLYEKGWTMRAKMRRCTDYTQGKQWNDFIEDPDSRYRQMIKEEDYIKRQGFVPLRYNIMQKSKNTTCGLYANQYMPPTVGVHGDDEASRKTADMVTCALRSAGQSNQESQLLTSELEEAWMKGLFLMSVHYKWDCEKKRSEVFIQHEDPYKLIIENDLTEKSLRDARLIGMIRDMPLEDVIHNFASTPYEAQLIQNEYSAVPHKFAGLSYTFQGERFVSSAESFYVSTNPNKCRVFEIWRKETEQALFVHDYASGMDEYRSVKDWPLINQENVLRIKAMLEAGGTMADARLIAPKGANNGWTTREYWYVRYITPLGHVLKEEETPYNHGSHPFVIGAFPMTDGEIHSPAESLIDVQRALNRTFSQIDFMRQRGTKGVLMVDVNAIPDNISWQDFADEYSRNGSVLFLKMKPNAQMPEQLKSATIQDGDVAIVNMYKQFADEISGVSGALRGERATADTPASLYAQQAANSENNIAYFMNWFNGCVDRLHEKMMMVIQQYYEDKRYLAVTGNEFDAEARRFRQMEARLARLYIEIVNINSVSFYKAQFEQTLSMALQTQAIDFLTYLKNTRAPFADRLAKDIERRQQALTAMQQTA